MGVILLQVFLFILVLMLAWLPPVRRFLTPASLKRDRVRRRAYEQFLSKNLQATRERTGVLIFVSEWEHMAELIADEGVAARVDPAVWDEAMSRLVKGLKAGRAAEGFEAAVEICGAVLAEHFPPLHPQMPACSCGGRPAIHIKLVTMSPVGTKHRIQNTPILQRPLAGLRLKNNSSGTIPKQHACRPVGPVKNARKRLCANHQRPFVRARNQKLVGDRQRIDKSRAHRLHVECRTAMNAECRLHLCRCRGKGIIRRRRCQHDQIDIGRKTPGILDRPFRGARREHRGRLALGRNMAALDTGPLDNPVIRCIDDFFNVRIGENAFGQVMSAADHN
jgi:hypothetical protein